MRRASSACARRCRRSPPSGAAPSWSSSSRASTSIARCRSRSAAIFADYTDLIEPLSLDEAYLDVTEDRLGFGSARAIAEDIRRRIREETGLTASAGGQLLQVHRQARLRPPQARRAVRHPARARRRVRRVAAGGALPRRRAGHRAQDGAAGHP